MKVKLIGAAVVLALVLAAMPNVTAGDVTISDVTIDPAYPKQGDTIHLKAKVIATLNISWVRAFPCWEKPTYTCGMPVEMKDDNKDGFYEANLSNAAWTNGNVVHVNVSAMDSSNTQKIYTLPLITIGAGTGTPDTYTTEGDCESHSYFWWDDACHAADKQPSDYKTKENCTSASLFWWDNKCNAQKGTIDKYTDKDSCTGVGYFWYDGKCNADKKKAEPGFLPAFEGVLVFSAIAVAGLVFLGRKRISK